MAVVVSSLGLPLDESNVRNSIRVSSFDRDEVFEVSQSGPPKKRFFAPPISIHLQACFRTHNFSNLVESIFECVEKLYRSHRTQLGYATSIVRPI